MRMYSMGGGMDMGLGGQATLVLNANHPLVKFVTENKEDTHTSMICKQLYDLAMIAHKPLNPEEMTAFVQRSNEIMMLLTKWIFTGLFPCFSSICLGRRISLF